MNAIRRNFLKSGVFFGAAITAMGAGLLAPGRAFAAYLADAFAAKDVSTALKAAVGSDAHTPSSLIQLKAPDIAENGAVVPITVSSTLPNVESISIVASGNDIPFTSIYQFPVGTEAFVSTRIKMAKTADVIAVVKSDGQLFSARKEVKVTIGGCGG